MGMLPSYGIVNEISPITAFIAAKNISSPPSVIANLREIFPNISSSYLKYLYKLSSYSLSNTVEFLTKSCTFASLCGLGADSIITTALEESPCIIDWNQMIWTKIGWRLH